MAVNLLPHRWPTAQAQAWRTLGECAAALCVGVLTVCAARPLVWAHQEEAMAHHRTQRQTDRLDQERQLRAAQLQRLDHERSIRQAQRLSREAEWRAAGLRLWDRAQRAWGHGLPDVQIRRWEERGDGSWQLELAAVGPEPLSRQALAWSASDGASAVASSFATPVPTPIAAGAAPAGVRREGESDHWVLALKSQAPLGAAP